MNEWLDLAVKELIPRLVVRVVLDVVQLLSPSVPPLLAVEFNQHPTRCLLDKVLLAELVDLD